MTPLAWALAALASVTALVVVLGTYLPAARRGPDPTPDPPEEG